MNGSSYGVSQQNIASRVLAEFGLSPRGCAVLLNGQWGSGKTYCWNRLIVPSLGQKMVLYVSVFGAASLADVKGLLLSTYLVSLTAGVDDASRSRNVAITSTSPLLAALPPLLKALGSGGAALSAMLDKIDLSALLPQGVTICFDDVERAANGFDVGGLLGLVEYLVEVKSCHVMLLSNSSKIDEKSQFFSFRERVISLDLTLEPDPTLVLPQQAARLSLDTDRRSLTAAVRRVPKPNLRSIPRFVDAVLYLRTIEPVREIPPAVLCQLFGYISEKDSDVRYDPDAYSKDGIYLLMSKEMATAPEAERWRSFIAKFYENPRDHNFLLVLYDLVYQGVVPVQELKDAIWPPQQEKSTVEQLLEAAASPAFWFNDHELRRFLADVRSCLMNPLNATAAQIARLIGVYEDFCGMLNLPSLTEDPSFEIYLIGLLNERAKSGDDSWDPESRGRMDQKPLKILSEATKGYQRELAYARLSGLREEIAAAIVSHDIAVIYRASKGSDWLDAVFGDPDLCSMVSKSRDSNREFHYSLLHAMMSDLANASHVQRWRALVEEHCAESTDAYRMGRLIYQAKRKGIIS